MGERSKGSDPTVDQGRILAPWEKSFAKFLTPFEEFIHRQTTGGLLLMCSAFIALAIANSTLSEAYLHLIHTPISLKIGVWGLAMSLQHWVNDGLMVLFFFVVGLELKREFLVGELANLRNALLPVIAAIGGMMVPALIYFALNPSGKAALGWGIPMATDIAFAIGALAILASRVPKALITFLVALAIIDDLGAVLVIAVFYTETIATGPLLVAVALFGVLMAFNQGGIRNALPYFFVALFLWYALLLSGVHATLAGVLGAMAVPAIPKYNPDHFRAQVRELMHRFEASHKPGESIMTNITMRAVVQSLGDSVYQVQTPLQRLEHIWHMPVAYVAIPIFALVNAGIPMEAASFDTTLTHPVLLGVSVGLVLGKFIGITGASWLVLKLGVADLPTDTRFSQIAGVSLLAGIGFTMSIFVSQLGFKDTPELLLMAKTGILLASLVSGACGFIWLLAVSTPARSDGPDLED